eukprot:gene4270-14381_t
MPRYSAPQSHRSEVPCEGRRTTRPGQAGQQAMDAGEHRRGGGTALENIP